MIEPPPYKSTSHPWYLFSLVVIFGLAMFMSLLVSTNNGLTKAELLVLCAVITIAVGMAIYNYTNKSRLAEESLNEAHTLLRSILDGVAEPMLVIGRDYRVIKMNLAAQELWKSSQDHTGTVRCHEIFHRRNTPCDEEDYPCPLNSVFESGKPVVVEHKHINDCGEPFYVEILGSPLRNKDGKITGIIESVRDISERKEVERQRADFYAMLTHDLKSPLTSIIGYSEIILTDLSGKFNSDVLEIAGSIRRSAYKIYQGVEDFVVLSMMESGKMELDALPYNVAETLSELKDEFSIHADRKGLELKTSYTAGLPLASFDKRTVQRAVANLLQNAVNYTQPGGTISLTAEHKKDVEGEFIVISVMDTGSGIPKHEHAKLFEKYYRSPGTSGIKGSGLGLAIVKLVAEAHGGSVELQSVVGNGSTFRLYLPVHPQQQPQPPGIQGISHDTQHGA